MDSFSIIPGFEIRETLCEACGGFNLYRGIRQKDQQKLLLKVPTLDRPSRHTLLELENELKIAKDLNPNRIVRPLSLDRHFGRVALFLEDFDGESLDHFLHKPPLDVETFLRLSICIVDSIIEIHRNRIVHRNINPQSIFLNSRTNQGKILNFDKASILPREQSSAGYSSLIETALPYISPEQTGRMDRFVDFRTDLYSIGVVFYQLLSGKLPFEAEDTLGWVYCHIAQTPQPLHEIVPSISKPISDIISKLLAKAREDRYQSAFGLKTDLEKCLAQWNSKGQISLFPLGEKDVLEFLEVSQKLYGREKELAILVKGFDQVLSTGIPQFVLISGYSGVGKTSLVNELRSSIIKERGFFKQDKFDLIHQNIPNLVLSKVFRELILEILAETSTKLQIWKFKLTTALGIHAQLIIDLIPELEIIIGKQPPVADLPLVEAQNRFQAVLHRFVSVFATNEHPLVLFFDDLQWADSASLKILQYLMTQPDTQYLMLLGAYRGNEVTPSHLLTTTLNEIQKSGGHLTQINLPPLSPLHLQQLISDTFHAGLCEVKGLSELVYEKTQGYPFFTVQFLNTLYQEQLVEFDSQARTWIWNLTQIQEQAFTNNVLEFMITSLKKFSIDSQDVLKLAACAGNEISANTLALMCERPEENIHKLLYGPLREGLMTRQRESYRFIHDKVRQAAYHLIPQDQRAAMHLKIGRILLSQLPEASIETQCFYLLDQFNQSHSIMNSYEEKEKIAHLNLIAGIKAKHSTAYTSANNYLSNGIRLLRPNSWKDQYNLSHALYLEKAECEFLSGDFKDAEQRLSLLLKNATNRTQKTAIFNISVQLFTIQGRIGLAFESASECLNLFGINLKLQPNQEDISLEFNKIWKNLGNSRIEELFNLPMIMDPEKKEIIDILSTLTEPSLFLDNNLFCHLLCIIVNLSIQYGNTERSAVAYTMLGAALGPIFGKYEEGYQFGKLGYDLVEKQGLSGYKAKVYLSYNEVINPHNQTYTVNYELLNKGIHAGMEVGDLFSSCNSYIVLVTFLISKGEFLSEVFLESEKGLAFARRAKFDFAKYILLHQQRFIQNLRGHTLNFHTFNDSQFDEIKYEKMLEREASQSAVGRVNSWYYYVWKLQARVLSRDYKTAVESALKAKELIWTSMLWLEMVDYYYFASLAMASHFSQASPDQKNLYLAIIKEYHARLKDLTSYCRKNVYHKYALVEAEMAKLNGESWKAAQFYEVAIRFAKENGFVHNEGIAYELATKFYEDQKFDLIAESYLREARSCYLRWEAFGKVRALDQCYPQLSKENRTQSTINGIATEHLDVMAVAKASQTISSEICLEKLIKKLIQILVEQSGAEKAVLILPLKGELIVSASATIRQGGLEMNFQETSVESSNQIPISMVNYVWRTKKKIVYARGAKESIFSSDRYIQRIQPLSVLCLPIVRQASITGLIYLENNHLVGTFTLDQLEVLELLATQAAIAIENALLYSNLSTSLELERKAVQVRDEFISIASHELRTPLTTLSLQVQFMEKILQHPLLTTLPESKRFAQIIQLSEQQIKRFSRLIENLLDVSRINSGQMVLKKENVDLRQLVQEQVNHFKSELQRSGSKLELHLEPPAPGLWDKFRIEQVIGNLISNAIKFGLGKPIQITLLNLGKTARLIVRDFGVGIPSDAQLKIFDRFERGASIQKFEGLGLGLYIASQIALAHEGKISVDSKENQGATFTVELPIQLRTQSRWQML